MKKFLLILLALTMCFQVNIVGASENTGGEVSIDKIQHGSDYRVITIDKNYTGSIDEIWHWTMNSVESVNVDKDNPKYMSEDGILFSKDKKTILYYPRQKNIGGSYTIPETVEKIAEHAFNNAQLKTIKMEDSITSIGTYAFAGCGVVDITVPKKVKVIAEHVFAGSYIKNIDLNNVNKIKDYAFSECNYLTKINLKNVKDVGKEAFANCNKLKTVKGPKVKNIGKNAFYTAKVKKIYLPNSVKMAERALNTVTKISYTKSFKKIKPYMLYPFTWNDVDTAKGYQVKITISSKKNKKIKKTFVEKTKKSYIPSYGKLDRKMGKFVSKNKITPKDVKSTFQYRAYRKKGGKTLYTKWSNVVKL